MGFSKPYLADYRMGRVNHPTLPPALAVTASSALPVFLSPCKVDLRRTIWVTEKGNDLSDRRGFRDVVSLSDGGVPAVTRKLAAVPTRLDAIPEDIQEKLVNGGYEICDTGRRAYVDKEADRDRLPCPDHPIIDA